MSPTRTDKQLRALIVDDERLARSAMRRILEARSDVLIVGEADSVRTAAELVASTTPDVIFLDIQMPGGSGFELFEHADVMGKVVFVTAYDEYAVRAFKHNTLDYLMKPVSPEEVDRALSRVGRELVVGDLLDVDLCMEDFVCLHEANRMIFTAVSDIVFISAASEYTEVHLKSGRSSLVDIPLKRWEDKLPATHFARTHRSTLVNLAYVDEVVGDDSGWTLHLRGVDGSPPMSRRYAQTLRKKLQPR